MDAKQFIQAFKAKIKKDQPTGYAGEWSRKMYPILEQIGTDVGFFVNDKDHGGEINHLDFAYSPKQIESQSSWYPPDVIIEHENQYDIEETWQDFWKLCLYAVPLRVMIGYKQTEEEALAAGYELTRRFDERRLRQMPNGETILIMGWDQSAKGRRWHFWLREGEQESWEYFQ